ncbi:hypothetical protein NDU88_003297 [Pleurodeles waltl]|uniref:Uncharacterized protein n=1 Tax=Pleurodeles waltl TaxID=8319 RepID=A0AAV7MQC2_PLEWA|nr:hypothetical protein NDU88_003297 [Pleurodeles waltl]
MGRGMVGHECYRQDGRTNIFPCVHFPAGQHPSEKGNMACHHQGRADPGVYGRQSTHCRKRSDDLRRWAWKTTEAHLGMASQRGRGAHRTLTPLLARILAVAYPDLDGHLGASQQPQGCEYSDPIHNLRMVGWYPASSGGGAEAPVMEGAASHRAQEAKSIDGKGTSGTECEESTTAETVRTQIPPPMEAPS